MHSIDLTTYAYVTSKDIIHVKEKINCYNVIQKGLTLIIFQKKTLKNITSIGQKFLTISNINN